MATLAVWLPSSTGSSCSPSARTPSFHLASQYVLACTDPHLQARREQTIDRKGQRRRRPRLGGNPAPDTCRLPVGETRRSGQSPEFARRSFAERTKASPPKQTRRRPK